jgi:CBS domain containing-hemolysin-like protein
MLTFILIVLLIALAVVSVMLRKTYAMVPAHELKRQAANGNGLARQLYQAVGYGLSLRVLLWILLALSSAGGFVLLTSVASPLLSVMVIAALLWFNFSWLPSTRVTGISTKVTQALTPALAWLLHYADPLLRRLSHPVIRHYTPDHSGLYELNDLLDLLDLQSQQPDSRITSEEIMLIRQVLTFGDKKVRDAFQPRKDVKSVALGDTVGPVLLDELHASGQSSFPVKKAPRSKEIVASLHLGDVGIHSTGTVEDYAQQGVAYISDNDTLAEALRLFYKTKQQLFVVVDNYDEYVGIITLENILHELAGKPPVKAQTEPNELTEADESDQTVVE